MANRDNHYEAACEAYLRERRLPYIAVDEARRSLVPDGSLKSLDFIVSPPGDVSWLVDVKGRRFPSGDEHHQYWKNWSTRDDLRSLAAWHSHFGEGFVPLLVFAYHLVGSRSPLPREQLFEFRGEHYGFLGVRLADFVPHARPLSESWDTVAMPTGLFRRAARPLVAMIARLPVETVGGVVDWHEMPANLQWETLGRREQESGRTEEQKRSWLLLHHVFTVPRSLGRCGMIDSLNNLAWEVVRLADASPALHFFGLLARGHDRDPVSNGPSGPPSYGISWALMLFCAILGLMVTLTPVHRTTEIKKVKEE